MSGSFPVITSTSSSLLFRNRSAFVYIALSFRPRPLFIIAILPPLVVILLSLAFTSLLWHCYIDCYLLALLPFECHQDQPVCWTSTDNPVFLVVLGIPLLCGVNISFYLLSLSLSFCQIIFHAQFTQDLFISVLKVAEVFHRCIFCKFAFQF